MWRYVILECTVNSPRDGDRSSFKRVGFGSDKDLLSKEIDKFNKATSNKYPRKFRIIKEIKHKR